MDASDQHLCHINDNNCNTGLPPMLSYDGRYPNDLSQTVILSEKIRHFLKVPIFFKIQHSSYCCLSLTKHSQSESGESVYFTEKSDLRLLQNHNYCHNINDNSKGTTYCSTSASNYWTSLAKQNCCSLIFHTFFG